MISTVRAFNENGSASSAGCRVFAARKVNYLTLGSKKMLWAGDASGERRHRAESHVGGCGSARNGHGGGQIRRRVVGLPIGDRVITGGGRAAPMLGEEEEIALTV